MMMIAATVVEDRIADIEQKIQARRANPNFDRNVEALETCLAELQRILALAEEVENV